MWIKLGRKLILRLGWFTVVAYWWRQLAQQSHSTQYHPRLSETKADILAIKLLYIILSHL